MSYHERSNELCPKCGGETWQDSADVGVGVIYGPRGCGDCGWSESDAYDLSDGRNPVDENGGVTDQFGGYYPPGNSVALAYRLAEGVEDPKSLFRSPPRVSKMDKREEMKPDWCDDLTWAITGMEFDELYEKEPDLEGGTEHAIRVMLAKVISQARSQAYEECAKIAESYRHGISGFAAREPDKTVYGWGVARRSIAQAIRQHSQKGGENDR